MIPTKVETQPCLYSSHCNSFTVFARSQAAVSHVYNAVTTDGKFGLISTAASSFDLVKVTTNDNAFRVQTNHLETAMAADASAAGGGSTLTNEALAPIIQEAITRWSSLMQFDAAQLELLNQITFQISDYDGLVLGEALEADRTIILDSDAAGYGWFIDATVSDDSEFARVDSTGSFVASSGTASGDMDLLSVVIHEMGHILGFEHQTANEQLSGLMAEYLTAGTRTSITRDTIAIRQEVTYYFDEATGQFVSLDKRYTADELEEQELAFYLAEEETTAATSPSDWLVLV